MDHKTLLSETNEMRKLMKLPLVKEQGQIPVYVPPDSIKDEEIEIEDEEQYDPWAKTKWYTYKDFTYANELASKIEKWWENENDEVTDFFAKDKSWDIMGGDDEKAAAKRYKTFSDTLLANLAGQVSHGTSNHYYKKMKDWLDRLVDEIDDGWLIFGGQDPESIDLTSPDGKESGTYTVDPEAT